MPRIGFSVLLLFSQLAFAQKPIRVLMHSQSTAYNFEVQGLQIWTKNETLNLSRTDGALKVYRENNQWQIRLSAGGQDTFYSLLGSKIFIKGAPLIWEGHAIPSQLALVKNKNQLQLIVYLELENYLKGVLPHEMPASWPLEALKAQAVASRSYAMWKMKEQKFKDYDVKSSIMDQVFRFDPVASGNQKALRAIEQTKGEVLLDKRKNIVKAYFHSDCGGQTQSSDEIWGRRDAPTQPVKDVACLQRKSNLWKASYTPQQLLAKVSRRYLLPAHLELIDIIPRQQKSGTRVDWVDLMFSKGIFKRVKGEDLRELLGYQKIKSTLFNITKQESLWVFQGKGFGHGVGLCQWGTRALAQSGNKYRAILAHYYPATITGNYLGDSVLVSFLHQ